MDPGATLSLTGARIAYKFKNMLQTSSTQVRTTVGNVSQASWSLRIMIEIDAKCKRINFRAMVELDKEFIFGMDFYKPFNIDVWLSRELWWANKGESREIDKDKVTDLKANVFAESNDRQKVLHLVARILADQPADPGSTNRA